MNRKEIFEALLEGKRIKRTVKDSSAFSDVFYFLNSDGELRYSTGDYQKDNTVDFLSFNSETYEIIEPKTYTKWKLKRNGEEIISTFYADEEGNTVEGLRISNWENLEKERTNFTERY